VGAGLIALCTSCTSKHPSAKKPKADTEIVHTATVSSLAPSALAKPASPAASCNVATAQRLDTAAATAFVQRWKLAQKQHDLTTYSTLYTEHFSGLVADDKSVGRLDRKAWLAAHASQLVLSAALAAAPAHIAIGAGGALVTFGSRSGRRSERLPEIFVISTSAGPKIAREAPARPAPMALAEQPGLWLANERFAFLDTSPSAAWLKGAPTFEGDGTASSAVAIERLPKKLRDWLGRPVRVLGASGTVCETRLQRFAVRAQISPDLATAEVWDGCSEDHPQTPAQIAEQVWQLSALEGRALVAELATPCKGALLAVDPDRPAPTIAAPEPASAELGAAALAAFRELPAYTQAQARFKARNPSAEGAWDDTAARRSVWSLELTDRRSLVFVSVEAGAGCASFSGSLSAVWETQGANAALGALLAVPSAEDDKRLTPRALVDFGAGVGILLGPDGAYRTQSLLTTSGGRLEQRLLTSVPFFAGPC
jgi:hypothetical protein